MIQNKKFFSMKPSLINLKTVSLIIMGTAVIGLSLQKITNQSLWYWSPHGQLLTEVDPPHHDDGPKTASVSSTHS
jgi:hypothetical protein